MNPLLLMLTVGYHRPEQLLKWQNIATPPTINIIPIRNVKRALPFLDL
jgi:hypothetical protein